ncbi:glycine betaine transporter [Cytobacillus oceanisediminis]|jgi:glycine betaine transporter|uniref:Glycine betaine transporter n=1 Tax=Cytobacillus oceanisediminis TaxID=665099 RepID=A0A2V2ZIT0_9BACI|nr:BCCT family transporter [Cytobacillus oceanisediminis]PWW19823.1 glycine betaine transporter [Cytobacillus oceanisediminis]
MKKLTPVFTVSVIFTALFILWGLVPESVLPNGNLDTVTQSIQGFILQKFGWFYLLSASAFLIFSILLIFTKYGNIRLGKDADRPEYNYLTWFAMLFSAGMGIGLVFWGVAEPMYHYYAPPFSEGQTPDAARAAMRYSFFHWGLHPWAIYTVIALALAYFQFRKGAPGVISSILRPILGDRVDGPLGVIINFIAVFATVFGVATSLGLGAIQITGGLSATFDGIDNNIATQLTVIAIVTILFMLSAQTGLNKGIKYLSNLNIILAIALMVFLLFVGPTNFIMDLFTTTIGSYLQNLPSMSFRLSPFDQKLTWFQDWTIFYWAWWIAWAPFVGTFIARISKGRTIREFVIGVLAVPTIFGALWFSVFGGTGIYLEFFEAKPVMSSIEQQGMEVALFTVFDNFPFSTVLSLLAIFLISTFFITSADSATFVLGMQTTNGSLNPSNRIKFVWGVIQSASAAILLWTGGLEALQRASIIAALPFTIIMLLIVISLIKSFKEEVIPARKVHKS